jgi:hypothetical protein
MKKVGLGLKAQIEAENAAVLPICYHPRWRKPPDHALCGNNCGRISAEVPRSE